MNCEIGRLRNLAASMLSFIRASRSLKMPTSLSLSTTITQPMRLVDHLLEDLADGRVGRDGRRRLAARAARCGRGAGRLRRSRPGCGRLKSVSDFAALIALVGAFDVLGFAVGAEDHAVMDANSE